jgi:hypothetical protein
MNKSQMIEAVAESWASMDGKSDEFQRCKNDTDTDNILGTFSGYMAEAEELLKRSKVIDLAAG